MAVTVPNMSGHSQNQLTRSLERILEEAHYSGELKLSGRKLKEFPKVGGKYNLSDTVIADLSKNRFGELPAEVTDYYSLERLDLYYNVIRTIPDTVILLQALVHLDLSRNQLSVLPPSICQLPLQVLLVSNNKLVSLPEEVGRVKTLTELDASCNEITHLPRQIGDLEALKSLSLRRNLLVELPVELTYLRLVRLDISLNRISTLPVELRLMTTLVILNLSHNPLTLPPAHLCTRGRVHIFKFLEIQALKEEKKKGVLSEELRRSNRKACHLADMRHANGITTESRQKRYMVDSGYVTGDDKRWSQEIRSMSDDLHRLALHSNEGGKGNGLAQDRGKSRNAWPKSESTPIAIKGVEPSNGSCSGASTPSTISPGDSMNLEEELMRSLKQQQEYDKKKLERLRADHDVEEKKIIANDKHVSPRFATNNINRACSNGPAFSPTCEVVANNLLQDEKKPVEHIQTYREYKEALKQQQRAQEGSIYRPRQSSSSDSSTTPTNSGVFKFDSSPYSRTNSANGSSNHSTVEEEFRIKHEAVIQQHRIEAQLIQKRLDEEKMKTLQKEAVISFVKSRTSSVSSSGSGSTSSNTLVNGSDAPDYENNGSVGYRPRSSPVKSVSYSKSSPTIIPTTAVSSPKLVTTSMKYVNSVPSSSTGSVNNKIVNNSGSANVKSRTGKSSLWSREVSPVKLNFTMRREYEKAREEAELISQLKNHIETRLKMSLPDDVSSALMDGVVLCHLANHVRPRSVASIHVPSPAMPKLSLAKCRRNVDNFLEACRRIGVEENLVCCAADVLEGRGLVRVAVTVSELLRFHTGRSTAANAC